jgi:hypothetical protein
MKRNDIRQTQQLWQLDEPDFGIRRDILLIWIRGEQSHAEWTQKPGHDTPQPAITYYTGCFAMKLATAEEITIPPAPLHVINRGRDAPHETKHQRNRMLGGRMHFVEEVHLAPERHNLDSSFRGGIAVDVIETRRGRNDVAQPRRGLHHFAVNTMPKAHPKHVNVPDSA